MGRDRESKRKNEGGEREVKRGRGKERKEKEEQKGIERERERINREILIFFLNLEILTNIQLRSTKN